MKHVSILIASVLICSIASGKIWRVNNVAGATADFTTIQTAHDDINVVTGDTLHMEPSATSYGSLTMTKRLTLISIGNFLFSNPGLQHNVVTGTFNSLTINNVSASGSVFHCNMTGTVSISNANSIRFERCRVQGSFSINFSGSSTIMNSYFSTFVSVINSNNVSVFNNIFSSVLEIAPSASAVVMNNVLNAQTSGTASSINNSIFENNIINKPQGYTFTGSQVHNNLTGGATLPAGNGNLNSVNMATVFANQNGTDDISFVLLPGGGNPAIGIGVGGVDAGAFGGSSPFKLGLQAAVPSIYFLSAPLSPGGSTMNVTFSTRGNN